MASTAKLCVKLHILDYAKLLNTARFYPRVLDNEFSVTYDCGLFSCDSLDDVREMMRAELEVEEKEAAGLVEYSSWQLKVAA